MQTLVIENEKKDAKQQSRRATKSRSFSAFKLAHVCADMLWDGGAASGDTKRPVWLALTESDTALRPFLANLRLGRKADVQETIRAYSRTKPTRFELMKSAGYSVSVQRVVLPDGSIAATAIALLPLLLTLDAGLIDPECVNFVALPPRWWVEAERQRLRADYNRCAHLVEHIKRVNPLPPGIVLTADELIDLAPMAVYTMGYLDRRIRRPLIPELAFAVQLYLAGLRRGVFSVSATASHLGTEAQRWATHTWAATFEEDNTEAVGLLSGVVAGTTHQDLDPFLIAEVQRYAAVQF